MNKYEITQKGLDELKKELIELKKERTEVIETIKVAKSFGDLSENAEYSTARERQTFIETRLQDVEDKIKKAILVDSTQNKNIVGLGSKIEIVQVNNSNHNTKVIELVSSAESDPIAGKISQDSPLGMALVSRMIGDEAVVKTPQKELRYKIKKIF
ncbi:MAG: transcription elongation factor GreA [Candidatus Pacebacteria bacterium]|nr:transcription elongation factor GreA [Candidatus Paceibacterota bacterium]MDD3808175.1 transcription elongation factor GreA [Candidatus Paceibacterota bacterium]